jgi:H+/Cl- antiporter ClcA/PII-like signaling protein
MSFHWNPQEQVRTGRYLLKWTVLGSAVGILAGSASAVFLISLQWATDARVSAPWLLYLLPIGGCLIGLAYQYWGKSCEGGNNLLLEEIHKPGSGVSGRLAPLILLSTVATHLFGGSAGREGTALQMGGSLAGWFARRLRFDPMHTRILLMAGISGGFGSVFGTPLAGMVFGLEVLAVGRIRYDALIPCLVSSVVGDWTCSGAWGVHHTHYHIQGMPEINALLVGKVLLASLAFALVSVIFGELTHWLNRVFKQLIPWAPGRPVLGGLILIGLVGLLDTRDYLGLGVPLIVQSFTVEGVPTWAFAWKLLFTALTLGSGFKGGEVTPLFFMGATLGCVLGQVLGVPSDFMAGLGFVAVFAGAANTPLACTIMGVELFGAQYGVFLAVACCSSYIWSGHRGIYLSQIVDTPKIDDPDVALETTLGRVRESQVPLVLNLGLFARFRQRFSARHASPVVPLGEPRMSQDSALEIKKVGVVRIYLSAGDRLPAKSWKERLFARPLYQEIIDQARQHGLWGAFAKGMTYGFTHTGEKNATFHVDSGFTNTHIYVELIAPRPMLVAFVEQIAPLIQKRVATFSEVEHWAGPVQGLTEEDRLAS